MLKFHPITAFMKMHANFQKIFSIRVFWFRYIFPIKYKIPILDLMLLPKKNSVPFEGLNYSSDKPQAMYVLLICNLLNIITIIMLAISVVLNILKLFIGIFIEPNKFYL